MLAARSTSRGSHIELVAEGTAQSDDTSLRAGGVLILICCYII